MRHKVTLRRPRPGDMGWVVQRHGEIYAQEYGWNWEFEGLVAGVVSQFVKNFDPKRERCWIAERNGKNVGAIFCFKKTATIAKLRMLFVDKEARGLGLGSRLVHECIAFARRAGYKKMTLWTESPLTAARRIYAAAGFRIVSREPVRSFGKRMVSEIWELDLRRRSA
jgi:GNAT superfamily N-acetyltransferase